MMFLLAFVSAACVALSGPNITAGDLAKAVPSFHPADGAVFVAYGPNPGLERVMHPPEALQQLARLQFKPDEALGDVCFERQVRQLTDADVTQAIRQTLGATVQLEIVERTHFAVPEGEVVFPREGLGAPPVALWNGFVRYDGTKKFPVWARVKVTTRSTRLIATEELKPGIPIKSYQVTAETVDEFPQRRAAISSADQIEGALPRRFIAANTPIYVDAIDPPNDITKGDRVAVQVTRGLAQLRFDAEAQGSGRRGDLLSFKNPESGKLFRARVDGPHRAEVTE